jgi:hypothetical protein
MLVDLAIEEGAGSGREAAARTGGLLRAERLLRYLEVTVADCEQASKQLVAHARHQMEIAEQRPGPRDLDPDEIEALGDGETLAAVLHLRIETFYVFAKVLLDQLAHAIECYFGRARATPIKITKHSELVDKLTDYASTIGLSSPERLLDRANSLTKTVVAFREKPIIHDQSPRSSKATSFDAEGRTRISDGRIFPSEDEMKWTESELLHVLMTEIEGYVEEVCFYLRENREVTAHEWQVRGK